MFENPTRSSDRYFTVLARPNDFGLPRLGLAIAKKAVGGTNVARNRFRRLVRESFRLNQHDLPSVDVVVTAKTAVQTATKQQLHQSLIKHWRSIERQCVRSSLH